MRSAPEPVAGTLRYLSEPRAIGRGVCGPPERVAGALRYLSERMTIGRVVSIALMSATRRLAIGRPTVAEVESGISLPIDHSTTAGEFFAALTISAMSLSLLASKKRP